MAASPNLSHTGTQEPYRDQLLHHEVANVAHGNTTKDADLNIVTKTRNRKNKKQHVIGCE